MKVFVSFHDNDEELYRAIKAAFKPAGVDVYRHSLDGPSPRLLFDPEWLYDTLNCPDLALAIISPHQCADPWFQLELPALFSLESRLKSDFILPVLSGDVGEQNVPLYLRDREYVDLRSSAEVGMARLGELIKRASERNRPKVFLVHGHDNEAKESVARVIEKQQLGAVILHEQANLGRTIIEKLEDHVDACFVVVLLTPDDVGASRKDAANLRPRARQNVIFELGLFIGKLGRGRVCALLKGDVELPSDYHGILPVPMDEAGAWKTHLIEELRQAGCIINANKA